MENIEKLEKLEENRWILHTSGIILLLALLVAMIFCKDLSILLSFFMLFAFVVFEVFYIIVDTTPSIHRVIKYRKEPWPQKHKFLWVLVGLGYAQVAPAWFVLSFRNNDMVARITVVISIIVLIVANSAVKKVEKEKTRTKEQGKGLE